MGDEATNWQQLPDGIPEGAYLRNPIKVNNNGYNYWAYETRHNSDGWKIYVHNVWRGQEKRPAPFWQGGSWYYAATFAPGWVDART